MKTFIVPTSTILKHLQFSVGVISGKAVLPAIDNFLFELEKEKLKISSTDLETTLTTELTVKSTDTFKVLIPARMLIDILKTFPEQPIIFKIDEKTFAVEITTDSGKFKMSGFDVSDFPTIPKVKSKYTIELSSNVLKEAINKTIFACGKDEIRPVMTGMYFDFTNESLNVVATDAHKLVRYKIQELKTETPFNLVVPKKPLSILKNEFGSDETKVNLTYNKTHISISYNQLTIVSKLIDIKYPNYEAVIPIDNNKKLIIDKELFINSVRRTLVFSSRTNAMIKLKFTTNEIQLETEDIDYGNEAVEKHQCQYEGEEEFEIGFNGNILLEMLVNIDSENVLIEMFKPNRAVLMYHNGDNNKNNTLMLLMPFLIG